MSTYIGRFAPSPTGPLHLGSLYTALASYLDAKSNHGQWLVRIEDTDIPRNQTGASDAILACLTAHELNADHNIVYQQHRLPYYEGILQQLSARNLTYPCNCSRQQLVGMGEFYKGLCQQHPPSHPPYAIRLRTPRQLPSFSDRLLGEQTAPLTPHDMTNDFVIFRKDGFYAYQLAVVADDIAQGVTHIVRGSDILDSTFKQLCLYKLLNAEQASYLHLPVLCQENGQKLSKQNLALPINNANAQQNLLNVLTLLKQTIPSKSLQKTCYDILQFAIEHWDTTRLPKQLSIAASENATSRFLQR